MTKKIDLYCDAGDLVGLGHVNRSVQFVRFLGYEVGKINKVTHPTDIKFGAENLSNTCLIDSILLEDSKIASLSKQYIRCLSIEDWNFREAKYPNVAIIDWTVGVENTSLGIYRKSQLKCKVFQGIEYAPLNYEKNLGSADTILVYLGSGIEYEAGELIKALATVPAVSIILVGCIVASDMPPNVKIATRLSEESFLNTLKKCKLFITSGGWSMYQAAAMGVQIGLIVRDGNSVLDTVGCHASGSGQIIGYLSNRKITFNSSIKTLNNGRLSLNSGASQIGTKIEEIKGWLNHRI